MSPEYLAHLVSVYGYIAIFPLATIEGPILTVIGGFLVSLGLLNPFLIYIVVLAGDVVGDSACYALGRWGRPLTQRYGGYIGLTKERLANAQTFFHENHQKAVIASKLIHGIGWTGLIAAGSLHVPYWRFARTCFFISAVQSVALLIIGVLFGHAYLLIEQYLSYFAAVVSVAALAAGLLYALYRLKRMRKE
jgi:membrane-associated protein